MKRAINLLKLQGSQSDLDLLQKKKQESEEAKNAIEQELTKAQERLEMQKMVATAEEEAKEQGSGVTEGSIAAIGKYLKNKGVM